jgi:hypothetical protein
VKIFSVQKKQKNKKYFCKRKNCVTCAGGYDDKINLQLKQDCVGINGCCAINYHFPI